MLESNDPVAHLVHGTWPRGKLWLPASVRRMLPAGVTWYDEGSDFRADLAQLVGGQLSFEAFEWSGSNSILTRKKATEALKHYLAEARWRRPDARHFVIAHSHGGNVALEAVRDQSISGLITLGTPFLHTHPYNPTRAEVWLLDRALIGAIRLPLLLAMLALFWYRSTQGQASQLIMLLFYALVFGWTQTMLLSFFMDQVRRDLGLTSFGSKHPLEKDLFNFRISKPLPFEFLPRDPEPAGRPAVPLLVVRAEGDEAARALAMARTAAQAWATLWRIVPPIAQLVAPVISLVFRVPISVRGLLALAIYVSAILLNLIFIFNPQKYWYFLAVMLIIWGEAILGLIAAPLLFGTSAFYALGFGWEMLYTAHLLEIQVTSTPIVPVCEYVTLQNLQGGPGHLRHSLHEFPQVRRLIASWIKDGILDKT